MWLKVEEAVEEGEKQFRRKSIERGKERSTWKGDMVEKSERKLRGELSENLLGKTKRWRGTGKGR